MTTYVPFAPSSSASPPFQAQFTLDGGSYTASVTWNIAGQRWYISLTDQDGNLVFTKALVGSPLGYDINLAAGYFTTSTLVYRSDTGNFEQTP